MTSDQEPTHGEDTARDNEVQESGHVETAKRTRSWSRGRLFLHLFGLVILLAVAVYLEVREPHHSTEDKCRLLERTDNEGSAATYAESVANGYRNVRSRRVTVIFLREDSDPASVLNNVCEQREYISGLIRQLITTGASAIVIDKFFSDRSCMEGDRGTTDLLTAIQESTIPVIVGMATHSPESDPRNSCLILNGSLDFGNKRMTPGRSPVPAVSFGITRLNSDPRKVPLNWFVYANDGAFKSGADPSEAHWGTLSFVAASLMDNRLKDDS